MMNNFTLTDGADDDMSSYIVSNAISGKVMADQFEDLISSPVSTTRAIMKDLQ